MPDHAPDHLDEAAQALRATGRTVEPFGDDMALWIVDGKILTDCDLVALAYRLGLMDGPDRVQ